jgi:hypothetical protein
VDDPARGFERGAVGRAGRALRWLGWLGFLVGAITRLDGSTDSLTRAGFGCFVVLGGLGLALEWVDARSARRRGAGAG